MRDPEAMGSIGLGGEPSGNKSGVSGGGSTVSGRRPPEVIQRIVRQSFGRFRLCYEQGLQRDGALKGKVSVTFVITPDGKVKDAKGTGDLPDNAVKACVTKAFASLTFGEGEAETRVTYPINFAPEGEAAAATPTKPSSDPLAPTTLHHNHRLPRRASLGGAVRRPMVRGPSLPSRAPRSSSTATWSEIPRPSPAMAG